MFCILLSPMSSSTSQIERSNLCKAGVLNDLGSSRFVLIAHIPIKGSGRLRRTTAEVRLPIDDTTELLVVKIYIRCSIQVGDKVPTIMAAPNVNNAAPNVNVAGAAPPPAPQLPLNAGYQWAILINRGFHFLIPLALAMGIGGYITDLVTLFHNLSPRKVLAIRLGIALGLVFIFAVVITDPMVSDFEFYSIII